MPPADSAAASLLFWSAPYAVAMCLAAGRLLPRPPCGGASFVMSSTKALKGKPKSQNNSLDARNG
eukprot:1253081-Pyramimonas_sp.AAC.1